MAQDRTLKLSLLADTKNLVDGLKQGSKSTESFAETIGKTAEKALKAFALMGGAVAGFSIAFAKAAAEDEAAANKLAQTIGSVTSATDEQIKSVEQYITKTAIATGVTDDQLRPAFERLVRSTKDVGSATNLMNLSLDLAAATGKPLETVTNALAKAYDGNYTSLNRLGLGIDAGLIKSKDFNAIYETLNKTFGEFSEKRSEEAIVKFQRLQVAMDEAKEAVGAALLPAFERFGDWLLKDGVPRLNAFIAGLTGDKSLSHSFTVAQKQSEAFGQKVATVIKTVVEYKDVLIAAAAVTATVFAVSKIAAGVTATIALIRSLIVAYNTLKASAVTAAIATAFALNPLAGAAASAAVFGALALAAKKLTDMDNADLPNSPTYNDSVVAAIQQRSTSTSIGSTGSSFSVPSSTGSTSIASSKGVKVAPAPTLIEQVTAENAFKNIPAGNFNVGSFRRGEERSMINITINGAVDPASTARQIANILNSEASQSGSFSGLGVSRFATRVD